MDTAPALSEPGTVVDHDDRSPRSPHSDRYVRGRVRGTRPVPPPDARQLVPQEPGTETREPTVDVAYTDRDSQPEPPLSGSTAVILRDDPHPEGEHETGVGEPLALHRAPDVPHWADDPLTEV